MIKAWSTHKKGKHLKGQCLVKMQYDIMALANELRLTKSQKNKLQDQEFSMSDVVKIQEQQCTQIKMLRRTLENSIQPTIKHMLHLIDSRVLEKSIRETAANIIKLGIFFFITSQRY